MIVTELNFLLFLAPFSWGHPEASGCCFQSERLLFGREPNGVRAEPGKQKTRSCRTQELARSSGPRKGVAEKGWRTELSANRRRKRTNVGVTGETLEGGPVRRQQYASHARGPDACADERGTFSAVMSYRHLRKAKLCPEDSLRRPLQVGQESVTDNLTDDVLSSP